MAKAKAKVKVATATFSRVQLFLSMDDSEEFNKMIDDSYTAMSSCCQLLFQTTAKYHAWNCIKVLLERFPPLIYSALHIATITNFPRLAQHYKDTLVEWIVDDTELHAEFLKAVRLGAIEMLQWFHSTFPTVHQSRRALLEATTTSNLEVIEWLVSNAYPSNKALEAVYQNDDLTLLKLFVTFNLSGLSHTLHLAAQWNAFKCFKYLYQQFPQPSKLRFIKTKNSRLRVFIQSKMFDCDPDLDC